MEPGGAEKAFRRSAALVALVAFLPFAWGLLRGRCFFFRDLTVHFFPLRRFAVEGLLRGELRYWNPLVHEGIPMPFPPISYPFDLLHLLAPNEWGFSFVLALHVPLAAVAFMLMARGFGLSTLAAAGGALVYALGGFSLSTLNLYVYLEAMAWAPLLILTLHRAARDGVQRIPAAALCLAVALSTAGVEIVVQAVLIGLALSLLRRPEAWARAAISVALAAGLAAPTLAVMGNVVSESERGPGFATDVVLAHSIHPLTFIQVIVGSFYGDLSHLTDSWWGSNFFPRGFPYILSLYLGPAVLCLAVAGCLGKTRMRLRILALVAVAACVCLGRWAGLTAVIEPFSLLHKFRFPVKAFFTIHLGAALLASNGIDRLEAASFRTAWRGLAWVGLALGAAMAAAPLVPMAFPGGAEWFSRGFFPFSAPALRSERLAFLLGDAALGGSLALVAGLVALLVLAGRLRPRWGALAVTGLVAGDLLRTGASLNPMVTRSFFQLSAEMSRVVADLAGRGRIFTCHPEDSPTYWRARGLRREHHEVWSFLTMFETLTPNFNMTAGLPSAYSQDMTSLVPRGALPPPDADCARLSELISPLREAGVAFVLSVDPLDDPALRLREVVAPPRIAPLQVQIYEMDRPAPLLSIRPTAAGSEMASPAEGRIVSRQERPGRIDIEVETVAPGAIVVAENCFRGWSARLDGTPVAIERARGRYCTVPFTREGSHRVAFRYDPPGLTAGLFLGGVSLVLLLAIRLAPPLFLRPPSPAQATQGPGPP